MKSGGTIKLFISFVAGCVCSALAIGAIILVKHVSDSLKSWGDTVVHSDIQVRRAITDSGIVLPPASWNLFYAINGFQDHGVWISLTVSRDDVWKVVEESIHKHKEDFKSGIPEEFLSRIETGEDQKVDTSLWVPHSIKNPLHFSIREKQSRGEDWVVDEEGGRIFVTMWNT